MWNDNGRWSMRTVSRRFGPSYMVNSNGGTLSRSRAHAFNGELVAGTRNGHLVYPLTRIYH